MLILRYGEKNEKNLLKKIRIEILDSVRKIP